MTDEPKHLTPAEAGAQIAAQWPPITDEQVEEIARILVTVEFEQAQTRPTGWWADE